MSLVTETLKQAILDLIGEIYHKCYIGPLKLIPLPTEGYDLVLGFTTEEKPLHIAIELEGDAFLKYLREELRHRHLADINFSTGYMYDPIYFPFHRIPCNHNCNHTGAYESIRRDIRTDQIEQ